MKRINSKILAEALYQLCEQSTQLDKDLKNFVSFLHKRNQLKQLNEILTKFGKLYDTRKKSVDVKVESAWPISDSDKKTIIQLVTDVVKTDQVNFSEKINKEIIGGALISFDQYQLDTTLNTSFKKLRNTLNK